MSTLPLDHGLAAIPGIEVGHCEVANGASGCSVVLAPSSAVAGVDVRGGAPGTREIALSDPVNTVASGVMRYLADHRIGVESIGEIVPIVSAAVLFDLGVSSVSNNHPGWDEGYAAAAIVLGVRHARSLGAFPSVDDFRNLKG